ncbi:MAG TPA: flagellin hook IN motif-containing protein, partial [Chloroflexota bacterium]|nr:flagellin hook IN motif-containing protein [Chloroflexota bacterium]
MAISPVGTSPLDNLLRQEQDTLIGQLSSGNRLITAAIDPAAIAVAEELTAQANGSADAAQNASIAASELETAGAAVQSQQGILQQENSLALQASNGTLTASDRQAIQAQIDELNQGLNDVANQTQFNTQPLLNGQAGGVTITGGGPQAENVTAIPGVTAGSAHINVTSLGTTGIVTGGSSVAAGTFQGGGSVTVNGPNGSATFSTHSGESAGQLVQQINGAGIGVTAAVNSNGKLQISTNNAGSNQTVTIAQAGGADITQTLGLNTG